VQICIKQDEVVLGQLWRHECMRVFMDKLSIQPDKTVFQTELNRLTQLLVSNESLDVGGGDGKKTASTGSKPESRGMKPRGSTAGRGSASAAGGGSRKTVNAGSGKDKKKIDENAEVGEDGDDSVLSAVLSDSFFVDFLRDDEYDEDGVLVQEAPKIYEKGPDMSSLTHRTEMFMNKFNEEFPGKRMNLILFEDAMRHLMRVCRVIGTPRGNLLFVGVGGSGKQSLSRLAAYMAGHTTFQIVLTKSYNVQSLLDDFRDLYKIAGQQGKGVVFLMSDAEVKNDDFLEVINSVLMTGEIGNLFPKDELAVIAAELRPIAAKERPDFVDTPDNLVRFFIDRVRANLHFVLAFSPVNPKLPERARKFPGLINGCSINFFMEWPTEALVAVGRGFIKEVKIDCDDEERESLIEHVGNVHTMVVGACEEYFTKMRRHVYQTPKSFLSFLNVYREMYAAKYTEIELASQRVTVGLEKLQQGAEDVETMKVVLADEEVKLRKAEEATNEMLKKLELSSMDAKKEADAVEVIKTACLADKAKIENEKALAEEDLAKAQPFVDEAERAVNSIKPNDLNELKKMSKPGDIIKVSERCERALM